MWNFNHPKGWERFHKYTSASNSVCDCSNDISSVETSYEKWSDRLNSILKDCMYGTVEIKSLEFVDDIADANNNGSSQAIACHKIITDIIERKRLKLSIDKCKLLRINGGKSDVNPLTVYREPMQVEETFKYLGDTFNSKGINVALCKHRVDKSVGSIIEIISLCKETNFGS